MKPQLLTRKFEIIFCRTNYKGKQVIIKNNSTGEYFWRKVANNGNELSRSSETYKSLQGCLKGLKSDCTLSKSWSGDITAKSVREWKQS